jgi:hypothetical protein
MNHRLRFMVAAMALATGLISVTAGTAGAALPLPITCTAAGTVLQGEVSGVDTWTIVGKGSCLGDLGGTYFLDFTGAGTSASRGLCDGALITNLKINVTGTLTNAGTGAVKTIKHDWVAPATTYPIVTPFLIEKNSDGSLIGGGAFFNHIFANCQGNPVAQYVFTFFPG